MPAFRDDLARRLWAARANATPIEPPDAPLDVQRGERIAAELYGALRDSGARQVGWKLALTDPEAQSRFAAREPFSAPLFDGSVIDAPLIRRSSLIAPLLEAEIAFVAAGGDRDPAPCVEIADCRFHGWRVKIGEGLADFGLQGAMLFGGTRAGVSQVDVIVRHDGVVVAQASSTVALALERLRWLEGRLGGAFASGLRTMVATGSVIKPIPLVPGRWHLDFGELGELELEVTQ